MSGDAQRELIIALTSLLFIVMSAGLGLIIRITARWTRVEDNLEHLVDRVTTLVSDGKEADERLGKAIDRLDTRLTTHEAWHADHPR